MFARYRGPEYWIADPGERSIEIYRLHGAAYVLIETVTSDGEAVSPLLPGFILTVADVFPPS